MAPKRKVQNTIKDAKAVKKRDQTRKDNSTICKQEEDSTKYKNGGKNNNENRVETKVIANLKKETLCPEYSEDNQNTKSSEFPNSQLNKLMKKIYAQHSGFYKLENLSVPFSSERSFSTQEKEGFLLVLTLLKKEVKGPTGHIKQVSGKVYLKVFKKWL